jgi:hypothetical protein
MEVNEGLPPLSQGRMMRKETCDMSVFAHPKHHHGKLSTYGAELISIRRTPKIALSCVSYKGMKLLFGDNSSLDEVVEEETLQATIVTLLVGQRNEPLIDHEKLYST